MTEETKVETPQIQEQSISQTVEAVQAAPQESIEDINWRKFRQNREEERKQREAAERYAREKEKEAEALKKAMEALVSRPERSNNEERELSEDEVIDKKVQHAIKMRELEIEKQRIEREKYEYPTRLTSTYKDFNEVCTAENLDYLEYHYPEVARGYKHMPDGFDKWEGLYQSLKRFIPNKNSTKDSKRADNNLSKPQAISRPGATQSGDHAPIIMDEAKRSSNWARMQKVIKGL